MSYKARTSLMLRMPEDPNEELDPDEWYGRTKISVEDWRELWGVPDWRDADAYPQKIVEGKIRPAGHVDLSQDQWRWEFLRRDSDYREEWDFAFTNRTLYNPANNFAPIYNTQKTCNAKKFKPFADTGCYLPDSLKGKSPLHYELPCFVHPHCTGREMPEKIFMRRYEGKHITKAGVEDMPTLLNNNRYGVFVFDVYRPLSEQIEQAQKHLAALQQQAIAAQNKGAGERGRKTHRRGTVGEDEIIVNSRLSDDFRHLLRLTDAYMERATTKEINAILYPGIAAHDAHTKRNKDMRKALHMYLWL